MTAEELRNFLAQRGIPFREEAMQNGTLFRCDEGEIFAAYDSGKVVCQGKPSELSKAVRDWKKTGKTVQPVQAKPQAACAPQRYLEMGERPRG